MLRWAIGELNRLGQRLRPGDLGEHLPLAWARDIERVEIGVDLRRRFRRAASAARRGCRRHPRGCGIRGSDRPYELLTQSAVTRPGSRYRAARSVTKRSWADRADQAGTGRAVLDHREGDRSADEARRGCRRGRSSRSCRARRHAAERAGSRACRCCPATASEPTNAAGDGGVARARPGAWRRGRGP